MLPIFGDWERGLDGPSALPLVELNFSSRLGALMAQRIVFAFSSPFVILPFVKERGRPSRTLVESGRLIPPGH